MIGNVAEGVEDVLDALEHAVIDGDSDALGMILAEDVSAFFSGGDTPVRGRQAVLATWIRHFRRWSDVRVLRRETMIESRGNVAWGHFLWDGEGRMGTQRYRLEGERWTVVLRFEDGCWRFVQMHSSMAYGNWEAHRVDG